MRVAIKQWECCSARQLHISCRTLTRHYHEHAQLLNDEVC